MKIAIHDISMVGVVDSENVKLMVEYTPENGDTTIDYGRYNVAQNIYRPGIDEDENGVVMHITKGNNYLVEVA